MTLVLSAVVGPYAFQVSDRRVSQQIGRRGQERLDVFERRANKNVVVSTPDALVTIGYSGHAFLGGVNTDTWIVRKLTGRDDLPEEGLIFLPGPPPPPRVLYLAVRSLCRNLGEEFGRMPKADRAVHELALVGWLRTRRGYALPLCWAVRNSLRSPTHFTIQDRLEVRRHLSTLRLEATGRYEQADIDWIHQEFRRRRPAKVRDVESTLVDAIRGVAARDDGVGSDCMCIRITPTPQSFQGRLDPHIVIRYEPLVQAVATIEDQGMSIQIPAAYSPWILVGEQASAPSLISGRSGLMAAGGISWLFESPPVTAPTNLLMSMDRYERRAYGARSRPSKEGAQGEEATKGYTEGEKP